MLTQGQRTQILRFDTCKIANALEHLKLRLRNEGFTTPGLHCVTGGFPCALGYAVTSRFRTADPPMKGSLHVDPADWWERISQQPGPSIAVIQDVDRKPGRGAVLSDVHAEILRALDCHAAITNGSVRNLPALVDIKFPVFSQFVAASHSYAHMLDFGGPVEILDLQIQSGDLIYVDIHGALLLPPEAVDDIIRVTHEQSIRERTVIDLCRSPQFSIAGVRAELSILRDAS